jgi:site-specific DNA-methyltransferase (adenine-specific)
MSGEHNSALPPYKRKEVIGDSTLLLGSCFEIMPHLPKVDIVVTDPPYSENTHKNAKSNKSLQPEKKLLTFSALSDDAFIALCRESLRLSDGWVVMTCDYRHAALMYGAPEFIRLGAWVKPNPMPQLSADRPGQGFETILILHAGKRKKKWTRGGGSGIWTFPVINKSLIPTQKPIALLNALIRDFTYEGETVLDPFMGSGTTGMAAQSMGRKFIGIESNEEHFEIACQRFREAYAQSPLFAPHELLQHTTQQ